MTTTLITGANKGLGFETARQLLAKGHTVYVGSRDAERGAAAAEQLGARCAQLDVTDDTSVNSAATAIAAEGGLDVLVNNAGIAPEWHPTEIAVDAANLTADLMRETFETNLFGMVRVLHAFLPLLAKSAAPVVVNVSSRLASLTQLSTGTYPGVAYPASKAEPGFTATDLNGRTGSQSPEQGAEIIVRMACLSPDGPTGSYVDANGPLPW